MKILTKHTLLLFIFLHFIPLIYLYLCNPGLGAGGCSVSRSMPNAANWLSRREASQQIASQAVALAGENTLQFTHLLRNLYQFSTLLEVGANAQEGVKGLKDRAKVYEISKRVSYFGGTGYLMAKSAELKAYFTSAVAGFVGQEAGYMYSQLVFGKLEGKPTVLSQYFKVTGMQYVLVVSGFHLSFLARLVLASIQSRAGKIQVVFFALLILLSYCLIVGFSPSLIRALSMIAAALICRQVLLRQYRAGHFFIVFCIVISLVHGEILSTISFQLSAAAVAGILYISPVLSGSDGILAALERGETEPLTRQKSLAAVQKFFSLMKESAVISISVNLALAPLLLYHFGEYNLISLAISSIFFWMPWLLVVAAWWAALLSVIYSASLVPGWIFELPKALLQLILNFTEIIMSAFANITSLRISDFEISQLQLLLWWLFLAAAVFGWRHIVRQSQRYQRLRL